MGAERGFITIDYTDIRTREAVVKYTVIIEEGAGSYSAYVPDLPGCIAAADSRGEALTLIQEALVLHLDLMAEHGEPTSEPWSSAQWIEVVAQTVPFQL